ncbi:DUF6314 family protein [Micromonospora sp. NPDC051925]|uniref:DUF6314 family protein n=1 Tax=Micromonospora sp. NPDC051925 TaxID=3364288 RepID=UPI0037C960B9
MRAKHQAEEPDLPFPVTPLRFLPGEWRVHRTIFDHRAHQDGVFTGRAVFSPGPPGELWYAEQGEVAIGTYRGPASRRLIYRDRGGPAMDVHFADGRPFYRLDLRDGQWSASHLCNADTYRVAGRLLHADAFTEQWHVEGPTKEYDLDTTYTRPTTS